MRATCTGFWLAKKASGGGGRDQVWGVKNTSWSLERRKDLSLMEDILPVNLEVGKSGKSFLMTSIFSLYLETSSVAECKLSESRRWRGLQFENWERYAGTAQQLWVPIWVWRWWHERVIKLSFSVAGFSLVMLSYMSAGLEKTNAWIHSGLGFLWRPFNQRTGLQKKWKYLPEID